ncbi:MAG: hypothetical protein QHH00_01425 [Methanomassiliicoccales archaeon]|jgi:predicted membrane channel-forming protein YqfA (hemolysin III family)|nr:hypothetical protein [Methanomassiliicoccales archaeon]
MAKKRLIRIQEKDSVHEGTEEIKEQEISWASWVKKTYLKYWYAVGCMFLDSFVILEIIRVYGTSATLAIIAFTLVLLVLLEVFIYSKIWKHESNKSGKDGQMKRQ